MAKIDSFSFGTIVIDGKKYHRNVIICPDGSVYRRKGLLLDLLANSVQKREIEELVKGRAEVAVMGKGDFNRTHLSVEAEDYAKRAKFELLALPSPEAVNGINQLVGEGRRVGAILH